MATASPGNEASWHAELDLRFERRGTRSVLAARRHDGPLVVQKSLHPEGDAVCHVIVLHPPAGIAGGDQLRIDAQVGPAAHALLTTPGATRWYRTAGPGAGQQVAIRVAAGGCLEWLPQENIVFAGALAHSRLEVDLEPGASFIGWDIVCLGRRGSDERFDRGAWRVDNRLRCGARLHWVESGGVAGGSPGLDAQPVLGGASVTGTFMAFAPHLEEAVWRMLRLRCLDALAEGTPGEGVLQPDTRADRGELAVTVLPGLLIGRYLGDSAEAARSGFIRLWQHARPLLNGLVMSEPRIWKT